MAIISLPYYGVSGLPLPLDQFAQLSTRMLFDCDGKPLADCDGSLLIRNQCPPRDALFGGDCILPYSGVWISGYTDGDIPATSCGSCAAYTPPGGDPDLDDVPWTGFWKEWGADNPCSPGWVGAAGIAYYISPASQIFAFQSGAKLVYGEIDGKNLQDYSGGGAINGIWLDCANHRWICSIRCNNQELWTGFREYGRNCYDRGLGTYTRSSGCAASPTSLTIITHPEITISPGTLPSGKVGDSYSETLSQTGGAGGGDWYVDGTAFNLPAGLSLNQATGEISGTPTVTYDRPVRFAYVSTEAPWVEDLDIFSAGNRITIAANATRAIKQYQFVVAP